MTYRKSYYEQRMDEQARIKEAVRQQIERQNDIPSASAPEPVVEVDIPDASWTKVAIQQWLDDEGIAWASSMTKAELLELI